MDAITFLETQVRPILRDETQGRVFWLDDELLAFLNEAFTEFVKWRPEAKAQTEVVGLQRGVRQNLPSDGYQLMEVVSNMDESNNPVGRVVRRQERATLDANDPSWVSRSESDTVKVYMLDRANPNHYFVSPPNDGTGSIEITFASVPTLVADDEMPVAAVYLPTLANYVLYRAFDKLTEDSTMAAKSTQYY